jgi:rRNA-processing protein FCF1
MPSSSADRASAYPREGLLIDSNLLLLLFVGLRDRNRIQKFKRTAQFTIRDFERLAAFIKRFKEVVTTPSILTEVSNLLGQLPDSLKHSFYQHFAQAMKNMHEQYTPSQELGNEKAFPRFGLTDTAILQAASAKYLVLTDDLRLAQHLISQNITVINFNQLRAFE